MPVNIEKTKSVMLAVGVGVAALLTTERADARDIQTNVLAGRCWCIEADFEKLDGVQEVVFGYSGSTTANPTYKEVTARGSGHYELVEITYDADVVSYDQLLHAFFRSVDATDAGGQFCDRGESYRTAIFVDNAKERAAAEVAKSAAQSALGQRMSRQFWKACRSMRRTVINKITTKAQTSSSPAVDRSHKKMPTNSIAKSVAGTRA